MPDPTLGTVEADVSTRKPHRLRLPGLLLMEHAAMGVVRIARSEAASHGCRRFVVLAGRGGNGGDGWAAARLLHLAGLTVSVHHLGLPAEGSDAHVNMRTACAMGIPNRRLEPAGLDLDAETLVVDAMFGIGSEVRSRDSADVAGNSPPPGPGRRGRSRADWTPRRGRAPAKSSEPTSPPR